MNIGVVHHLPLRNAFASITDSVWSVWSSWCTGKNNGFPFWDILGYLNNTHNNPKFGRVRQIPIRELGWEFVSLCQIWDFCGYSLNTLKYPKMGIRYFFLWWFFCSSILDIMIFLSMVAWYGVDNFLATSTVSDDLGPDCSKPKVSENFDFSLVSFWWSVLFI